MKKLFAISLLLLNALGLFAKDKPSKFDLQPVVFSLSKVMMHDVVNPPAASRYYAYCLVGANEIVSYSKPGSASIRKMVSHLPKLNISQPLASFDHKAAAILCIYETGKVLIPSGFTLQEDEDLFLAELKKAKLSPTRIKASLAVAKAVAEQVIAWSRVDNYFKLSTYRRYTPTKGDAYWYPTPPAYMEAVEPHWRTIRTIFIDSFAQFKPIEPVKFSTDTTSEFHKLAREVRDISKHLSEEQRTIAAFWDCNPFAISSAGHMMLGFKKMSPGAHWMGITGVACKQAKVDFEKSVWAHTLVACTLMDAFISCWDEKYRSNRVRPETFITRFIDPTWEPLLQTPPFPEYTSGHSVISSASAEVLTYLFGDHFSYVDDTEVLFELAPRKFSSFRAAALEAAVSRLYGGIHYRDAIDNGVEQGKALGTFVVNKLKTNYSR
jgi:membrane-associated phospholipid phosphatase